MQVSSDSNSRMDMSEEESRDVSPSRDRHRDWDRSRQDVDYDRDRDRDRHRDRDRDRSRSREDRDRDRDRDRGDREGERWMTEEPSATILLRGLNNNIVENDVSVTQEIVFVGRDEAEQASLALWIEMEHTAALCLISHPALKRKKENV